MYLNRGNINTLDCVDAGDPFPEDEIPWG